MGNAFPVFSSKDTLLPIAHLLLILRVCLVPTALFLAAMDVPPLLSPLPPTIILLVLVLCITKCLFSVVWIKIHLFSPFLRLSPP